MNTRNFVERASALGIVGIIVLGGLAIGTAVFVTVTEHDASATKTAIAPVTVAPDPATQSAAISRPTRIGWQPSFEAALAQSKVSGKPVMVDFKAKWCGPCRMMEEQTYPAAKVIAAAQDFVMVQVDVDEHPDLAQRYNINSLPTMEWMHADGKPFATISGGLPPDMLLHAMREAKNRAQKSSQSS